MKSKMNIVILFVLHLAIFSILESTETVNLSCETRLRECEREVKALLKKNSECSSDLDTLKVEISHLSEILSQYEKDVRNKRDDISSFSWKTFKGHLKHFASFFRALIAMTYSNIPTEIDIQLRSILRKTRGYLSPVADRYEHIYPAIYEFSHFALTKYRDFMNPYVTYFNIYGSIINERLDRIVAKIEFFEPQLVGSIPKSLCDRIFYIICVVLILYALLELSFMTIRLLLRCFGIRCYSCNASRKTMKPPSSRSTPSNRRR